MSFTPDRAVKDDRSSQPISQLRNLFRNPNQQQNRNQQQQSQANRQLATNKSSATNASSKINARIPPASSRPGDTQLGKSAFCWEVYRNRKTALQHLKLSNTLVDTILSTEDGSSLEFVHSQVISAFGDKISEHLDQTGVYVDMSDPQQVTIIKPSNTISERRALAQKNTPYEEAVISVATSQEKDQIDSCELSRDRFSHSLLSKLQAYARHRQRRDGWLRYPVRLKLVRLPKVTGYTLNILVDCAYTGFIRTDLSSGGIWRILDVATHYNMTDVIRACCAFLAKNLNRSNCIHLYHIGLRHKHALHRGAWNMIRANFKYILAENISKQFDQLPTSSTGERVCNQSRRDAIAGKTASLPLDRMTREQSSTVFMDTTDDDQNNICSRTNENINNSITDESSASKSVVGAGSLVDRYEHERGEDYIVDENEWKRNNLATIRYEHFEALLMHDKLNIDNEESVWYAIKLWCNYNPIERASKVASLLPCIRFPRFKSGTEYTARYIWRDALVTNSVEAQHQLAVLDRNHRDYLMAAAQQTSFSSSSLSSATSSTYYHRSSSSRFLRQQLNNSSSSSSSSSSAAAATAAASALLMMQTTNATTNPSSNSLIAGASSASSLSAASAKASSQLQQQQQRFQIQVDGYGLPCAINPRQLRPRTPHSILMAIGGWQQGNPTTLIESYDINCNMWFECKRTIQCPLAYHGIECINGLLYICGGTNGHEILNEVFTFNPIRGDCQQKASLRDHRCYVSTAYLDGYLYAIGGHNGSHRMKSVERLHVGVDDEAWQQVRDMNVARSDASACVHESRIYIAGGLNDQVIESSVEFYNPLDSSWTFIASMRIQRTSFTLLAHENSLLAIGGNNGHERLSSVEQYSFERREWREHSEMCNRRSTFSAALMDENKIIVVGGYNGSTPFSQVEMYDCLEARWRPLQRIRYDRSGLKVVVVSDLPNAQEYTFCGSQELLQSTLV